MGPLDNSAIADTVAAVFRSPPFTDHSTVSLGQLITQWLWNVFLRLLGFATNHPAVGLVLRLALGALLLVVLTRIAYGIVVRRSPSTRGLQRFDASRGADWWSTAQSLASQDDYTGAAHALYLALLGSAARRGLLSLHESKTTGDYLRELRRRPDEIDLPQFTNFTRSYETVIYGIGTCDQERYTRLNALAGSLLNVFPSAVAHPRSRGSRS